jgi:hypothetical protein
LTKKQKNARASPHPIRISWWKALCEHGKVLDWSNLTRDPWTWVCSDGISTLFRASARYCDEPENGKIRKAVSHRRQRIARAQASHNPCLNWSSSPPKDQPISHRFFPHQYSHQLMRNSNNSAISMGFATRSELAN